MRPTDKKKVLNRNKSRERRGKQQNLMTVVYEHRRAYSHTIEEKKH
jgi:hypothetical protein